MKLLVYQREIKIMKYKFPNKRLLKLIRLLKIPNYLYCVKCGATEGSTVTEKQESCNHDIKIKCFS